MEQVHVFEQPHAVYSGVDSAHSFFIASKGGVFALGMNTHGQLGLGDLNNRQAATRVNFFNAIPLQKIACGGGHSLFLTQSGAVYSCGKNTKGQLGLGNIQSYSLPRKIVLFNEKAICDVSCGSRSSYCVDLDGNMYKFGYVNSKGGSDVQSYPLLVNIGHDVRIVSISCGYNHVVALSREGNVYSFGYTETGYHYGQLGRTDTELSPIKVPIPGNEKVLKVICGGNFTNVIINDSTVYACGYNKEGELGLGDNENRSTPTKITFFETHPLRAMISGGGHTLCLLQSGEIVGYGYNGYNQLNLEGSRSTGVPTKVMDLECGERVVGMSCGRYISFFITSGGTCLGCGIKGGFASISNWAVPRAVFHNVQTRFNINQEHATDFFSLIMEEQGQNVEEGTTDLNLIIDGEGEMATVRLHKSLVAERSPSLLRDFSGSNQLRIQIPRKFTRNMMKSFLLYYYSERFVLTGLNMCELGMLRLFMSRYRISSIFQKACEGEIVDRLDTKNAAVDIFFEATDLGDEELKEICLDRIWKNKKKLQGVIEGLDEKRFSELNVALNSFNKKSSDTPLRFHVTPTSGHGCPEFLECMKNLFKKKETDGDFVIKCSIPGGSVQEHRAHKFVLVGRSDYFKGMIKGGYEEAQRSELHTEMKLGLGFELYLEYLYTGELRTDSEDCMLMLPCIQYFGISWNSEKSMKDYLARIVNSVQLNTGNCFDMLKMADELDIAELSEIALEFVVENYVDVEENLDSLDLHLQVLVTRRVLKKLMLERLRR